jgi:hypothetical protein
MDALILGDEELAHDESLAESVTCGKQSEAKERALLFHTSAQVTPSTFHRSFLKLHMNEEIHAGRYSDYAYHP